MARKLRVLDLFSGIGGFSLGLEATGGFETVAFCEIDPFCQKVLAKHWPSVPIAGDIKLLRGAHVREKCGRIDVVCGGFPCQDISLAGKGAGLNGARSGLWSEFHRLLEEIRPRYAIIENVSALRSRGLDQVLGSLAAIGYDCRWDCIPASAVGAPHRRDRVWIVAYPNTHTLPDAGWCPTPRYQPDLRSAGECDWWLAEPDVGRVAHGVPSRVDRLRALGNSLVPVIPYILGRAILAADYA